MSGCSGPEVGSVKTRFRRAPRQVGGDIGLGSFFAGDLEGQTRLATSFYLYPLHTEKKNIYPRCCN